MPSDPISARIGSPRCMCAIPWASRPAISSGARAWSIAPLSRIMWPPGSAMTSIAGLSITVTRTGCRGAPAAVSRATISPSASRPSAATQTCPADTSDACRRAPIAPAISCPTDRARCAETSSAARSARTGASADAAAAKTTIASTPNSQGRRKPRRRGGWPWRSRADRPDRRDHFRIVQRDPLVAGKVGRQLDDFAIPIAQRPQAGQRPVRDRDHRRSRRSPASVRRSSAPRCAVRRRRARDSGPPPPASRSRPARS